MTMMMTLAYLAGVTQETRPVLCHCLAKRLSVIVFKLNHNIHILYNLLSEK